jgi:hypothetical protein
VTIELEYLGYYEDHDRYCCRVTAAGHVWQYDMVFVDSDAGEDVEKCFDQAAIGAVHYGGKYNLGWDTEVSFIPDWAPPRDIAQAINDAASVDDKGYVIDRTEPAAIPHCG